MVPVTPNMCAHTFIMLPKYLILVWYVLEATWLKVSTFFDVLDVLLRVLLTANHLLLTSSWQCEAQVTRRETTQRFCISFPVSSVVVELLGSYHPRVYKWYFKVFLCCSVVHRGQVLARDYQT